MFIFNSCGMLNSKTNYDKPNTNQPVEILSGIYTIKQIGSDNNLPFQLTLEFNQETNKVSGFSGCNRFFGTYQQDGNSIAFSQLGSTKMLCNEDANKIESQLMTFLERANKFNLKAGFLTLLENSNPIIIANAKQEKIVITYQALSRGFFEEISISKDTLTICNDRDRKQIKSYPFSSNDWNECLELLSKIKTETLSDLKAPTAMRLYDGAAHATLTIKKETKEFQTSSFDHGHPPEEIKALVEKLLYFKKEVSKE
jgi:heat shock protein HslJ